MNKTIIFHWHLLYTAGLYNNIHWGHCHAGQFVHATHLGNNDGGLAKHHFIGGIKHLAIG